jgi:hypothetical protein
MGGAARLPHRSTELLGFSAEAHWATLRALVYRLNEGGLRVL